MNIEKMYYFDKFCFICMNKSDLKHLFEVDSAGVSHYNKLTSSIAEMNFKEMNDQRIICGDCCVTLNIVYNFRQMCLRSKTNLISQLQTSDHSSGTVRVCFKYIQPELIVVKNRGGCEIESSNCLEGSNPQNEFQTESYIENIDFSGSVKEECKNEDDDNYAHEDSTVYHVNESIHSDVKVEDVEHQTIMEDYSEYYADINEIEIKEDPLAEVKEEPMSDTETTQDGSTSQADTRTSEEPKGSKETTVKTELIQNNEKYNEGLHQCEICHKSFNGKESLMNHIRLTKHKLTPTIERPYKCDICKKEFKQKRYLTLHIITHSSKKPYECNICKKGFNDNSNLAKHIQIHSSGRPYKCEICKKGFKHKVYLTRHMSLHSRERPYKCKMCEESFHQKNYLTKHMMSHSSEKPYKCKICKKGFDYPSKLIGHMKSHSNEKPYECEICKKGFKHKDKVLRHMATHSSERPYECKICKKDFKNNWNLNIHMKTHSIERPYECDICNKGFKQKRYLTLHMDTHSTKRLYECEICKKGFNDKSNFTKHMKSHSDERRPYVLPNAI